MLDHPSSRNNLNILHIGINTALFSNKSWTCTERGTKNLNKIYDLSHKWYLYSFFCASSFGVGRERSHSLSMQIYNINSIWISCTKMGKGHSDEMTECYLDFPGFYNWYMATALTEWIHLKRLTWEWILKFWLTTTPFLRPKIDPLLIIYLLSLTFISSQNYWRLKLN